MKEIKGFIIDLLEHENRFHKKALTKNKRALQNPYPVNFTVAITRYWEGTGDEGNDKTVFAKAPTLEKAMEQAIKSFRDTNMRSNGLMPDGDYCVSAHLQNGVNIELPRKYWGHMQKRMERK